MYKIAKFSASHRPKSNRLNEIAGRQKIYPANDVAGAGFTKPYISKARELGS